MTEKDLLRLVGLVDEDLIEAAGDWKPARRRNTHWKAWLAACACVAIAVALAARAVPVFRGAGSTMEAAAEEPAADFAVPEEAAEGSESGAAMEPEETVTEETAESEAPADTAAPPAENAVICLLGVGVGTAEADVETLLGEPVSRSPRTEEADGTHFTARYAPLGDQATVEVEFVDAGSGFRVTRLVLDELSRELTLDNGVGIGMTRENLESLLSVFDGLRLDAQPECVTVDVPDYSVQVRIDLRDDIICRIEVGERVYAEAE